MRVNSYLLASGLAPSWAYVDTHQNPADGSPSARGEKTMVKKGLKIIKNQTKEDRREQRKKLGSVKSLTVQPKTRARYAEGMDRFWNYLAKERIELPHRREAMDGIVSDYLEFFVG